MSDVLPTTLMFPELLEEIILAIFKSTSDTTLADWVLKMNAITVEDNLACTLTLYMSFTRYWDISILCPAYVHKLHPSCASVNGVVYWVTWHLDEDNEDDLYIENHSIQDNALLWLGRSWRR
ncbi:hypothetical protein AHAS_Ahas18G0169600 [Arachis hypogaea]